MEKLETSFPSEGKTKYLKASDFQDKPITLTFTGWKKKSNEDSPERNGQPATSWKLRLKYMLRYSYPEFQLDESGEKLFWEDGSPRRNRNYDPDFPRGYSIIYLFEEGELESGSNPLFKEFCKISPKPGDLIEIKKTGKDKETKWFLKKVGSSANNSELQPDEEAPF